MWQPGMTFIHTQERAHLPRDRTCRVIHPGETGRIEQRPESLLAGRTTQPGGLLLPLVVFVHLSVMLLQLRLVLCTLRLVDLLSLCVPVRVIHLQRCERGEDRN